MLAAAGVVGCGSALHQAPPDSGADSVSVGFGGKVSRGDVASNIATVTAEDAQQAHMTRVSEMFRSVPGLSVVERSNGQMSVRINGMNGDPLFVLNGSPLPPELGVGALTGLQAADVVRIDVLRDADAAIYGVNGGNGVIVIETRHSRGG